MLFLILNVKEKPPAFLLRDIFHPHKPQISSCTQFLYRASNSPLTVCTTHQTLDVLVDSVL